MIFNFVFKLWKRNSLNECCLFISDTFQILFRYFSDTRQRRITRMPVNADLAWMSLDESKHSANTVGRHRVEGLSFSGQNSIPKNKIIIGDYRCKTQLFSICLFHSLQFAAGFPLLHSPAIVLIQAWIRCKNFQQTKSAIAFCKKKSGIWLINEINHNFSGSKRCAKVTETVELNWIIQTEFKSESISWPKLETLAVNFSKLSTSKKIDLNLGALQSRLVLQIVSLSWIHISVFYLFGVRFGRHHLNARNPPRKSPRF